MSEPPKSAALPGREAVRVERPALLSFLTAVGPVALGLMAARNIFLVVTGSPLGVVPALINVAGIFVLLGLRRGRHWAWVWIQVLWVTHIAWLATESEIWLMTMHPNDYQMPFEEAMILPGNLLHVVIIVFVWIYIRRHSVRAFCSTLATRKSLD